MGTDPLVSGLVALAFAVTHVLGGWLHFLRVTPRSIWLSAAGGVSVAYVFVHLLPELAEHQESFSEALSGRQGLLGAVERYPYLIGLIGLATFYGVERLARRGRRGKAEDADSSAALFWMHLGAFALYNLLIGYLLLRREESDATGLITYGLAMTLHFVVNDQALRAHHGRSYDRVGRWLLAAAPVVGWALGLTATLPPLTIGALFAFLAGGVVLNVLKEELPEERESRFSAFALGAAAYAALLLAIG